MKTSRTLQGINHVVCLHHLGHEAHLMYYTVVMPEKVSVFKAKYVMDTEIERLSNWINELKKTAFKSPETIIKKLRRT